MHPGADALTRTAERPRQRVGVVPGCEGTAVWVRRIGTIPSAREYRVRWHERAPACVVLAQPPTRSPMQANGLGGNRGGCVDRVGGSVKKCARPPPLSGPRPLPWPGDRVGGSVKTRARDRGKKKGRRFGRPPWAHYRDDRAGGARRGPGTSARYRSSARFNRRHARHKPRRFAALLVPPLCTGRTVALVSGPPAPQRAHPSSPLLGAAVPRRNTGPSPPSNRNSLMRALSRTRSRVHPRSARCATKMPAAHSRGRPGIGWM
jgi:hypothetical protein